MKKVLIIAYYFPPLGGGGVQRPLKFCKYLAEFGWKPIVLTAKNGVGPVYDETLIDELNTYKDVKVYRTFSFELGAIKNFFLGRRTKGEEQSVKREQGTGEIKEDIRGRSAQSTESREQSKSTRKQTEENSVKHYVNKFQDDKKSERVKKRNIFNFFKLKFFFQIFYNLLFAVLKKICIPDDKILWALPSFFSAVRIIKKENPDLIFVTIPPYSSFILGVLLKKWTGKKLVVDYRDPWNIPNADNKFLNFKFEKWCLNNTAQIIYVVPKIKDWLQKLFEIKIPAAELIYNGYDEDDYKNIEYYKPEKWTIVSGGDLYGPENIYFFYIFDEFIDENPEIKNNMEFIICSYKKKWLDDFLDRSKNRDVYNFKGALPKKKYLKLVKNSDIVALFTGFYQENIEIHGRLFDYLYLNKKILPVLNENSAHENLLKYIIPNIEIFRNNEKEEIKMFLKKAYLSRDKINLENYNIAGFSRKNSTAKISEIFRNLNLL